MDEGKKRRSRMGFKRSRRKSAGNKCGEKLEIWETEKTRQRRRDTRRKQRKRYKRQREEASHPFQKIANNHCHNRPYDTQDNIPNKQKFPDFWLAE
jgi:hypothetical protein